MTVLHYVLLGVLALLIAVTFGWCLYMAAEGDE